MDWTLARRTDAMNPSAIREILKLTERPGMISLAGGLPCASAFPVDALSAACERVLREAARESVQYAPSEGHGPLREWIAAHLASQGLRVTASQVLVTTGSQQALDLLGKVLVDPGSAVAVESPTYLGALQALAPNEPRWIELDGDDDGPIADRLREQARDARLAYLQPDFQNPTGRCIGASRRLALAEAAQASRLPLVEDRAYADLWFDEPPPAPIAAAHAQGSVVLGSFSKTLLPGLRVGYLAAPAPLFARLLQAKQAADLHTAGLNQRIIHQMVSEGLLERHLPALRALYRSRRDAMVAALQRSMPRGVTWNRPGGGLFLWLRVPEGVDVERLLSTAVARGVAFVPGAPFFASHPDPRCLRLSFGHAAVDAIDRGIDVLAEAIAEQGCVEGTAP